MKKSAAFLVIFVLAVIETVISTRLRIFGVSADLLLAFIVVTSFIFELHWLILMACFAGLLKDTFSIHYFGLYTILFCFWALASSKISKNISLVHWLVLPVIVLIVAIMNCIIVQLIFAYLAQNFLLAVFLKNIFIGSIYTTAVSLLIYRLMMDTGNISKI